MASKRNSTALRKFLILLYKGLLLRKRHYIVTVFEIVIPVIVACVPAIINSEVMYGPYPNQPTSSWVNDTIYKAFDPFISEDDHPFLFAYAPSNAITDLLMKDAVTIFKRNLRRRKYVMEIYDGNQDSK